MLTRLISAAVGLVLFFIIMFSEKAVLSAALIIISMIALYEVYRAYKYDSYPIIILMGIASSVLFGFGDKLEGRLIFAFLFILLLISVLLMLLNHDNEKMTSKDVAAIVFFTLAIPFIFSTVGYIKRLENGAFYVWLPFVIAWITDSAAYFAGRALGKHKLCEKISPKKTVEGAAGGVAGALAAALIFGAVLSLCFGKTPNYFLLAVLGIIGSVTSQMGDLFASCIKRENKIKDFGNIMPGHGGVLDRFDSLLLTIPLVYVFVVLFPII